MSQPLRVGIIGAGGIAQAAHIPAYKQLGDKVSFVAIADVAKERAEQAAEEHGFEHAFADYEEMLQQVELDAVSVCTPNKFHYPSVMAALEAGCHVLCEKPPAMTVEEAEQMANKAAEVGKILTYGFHFRHTPEVGALKRFIHGGELGDIYSARVHAIRRRGIPGWGVFTNKELQGGGPLIDIGVHMLDSALYLMGYPEAEHVFGSTYQKLGTRKGVGLMGDWDYENFSIEDMAVAMIKFKNGATIMLETAFAANVEKKEVMQVSLMGDEGGADVFPLKVFQEKHDTLVDITPVHKSQKSGHPLEIERFVDCCLTGEQPISTPQEGVQLQKIINGIYESAEKGVPISL